MEIVITEIPAIWIQKYIDDMLEMAKKIELENNSEYWAYKALVLRASYAMDLVESYKIYLKEKK